MEGSNFIENISKDFALCSKINAIYHTQKSKYQVFFLILSFIYYFNNEIYSPFKL